MRDVREVGAGCFALADSPVPGRDAGHGGPGAGTQRFGPDRPWLCWFRACEWFAFETGLKWDTNSKADSGCSEGERERVTERRREREREREIERERKRESEKKDKKRKKVGRKKKKRKEKKRQKRKDTKRKQEREK